jgi:hypothetical protein
MRRGLEESYLLPSAMRDQHQEFLKGYLGRIMEDLERVLVGASPRQSDVEAVFCDMTAHFSVASPDSSLLRYFLSPGVLRLLGDHLFRDFALVSEAGSFDRPDFLKAPTSRSFYQVRQLEVEGLYPSFEFSRKGIHYCLKDGTPWLVTKNYYRAEGDSGGYSDFNTFTRNEVKAACAVACSGRAFYFQMASGRRTSVDDLMLRGVEPRDQVPFLLAFASFSDSLTMTEYRRPWEHDASQYRFDDFRVQTDRMHRLLRAISIRDNLLLRTASHLVKSRMLGMKSAFQEDATANTMFALEGCLRLMLRKMGAPNREPSQANLSRLRSYFRQQFPYGLDTFDFVEEAMAWGGLRADLVHTEVDFKRGWYPNVGAEDLFEYWELTRALLLWILTDELMLADD